MHGINVLIVGSGGREATLAFIARRSPMVDKIIAAPGNPGIAQLPNTVCLPALKADDVKGLLHAAEEHRVDLTIVGPEGALGQGIVDEFRKYNRLIFGVTQQQANLELSKVFSDWLLDKYSIPKPKSIVCLSPEEAMERAGELGFPVVVKPDGNTLGKGVKICKTLEEARAHIHAVMVDHIYQSSGDTGDQIVLQEFLKGREMSVTAVTDGKNFINFPLAEDHKQAFDNDEGEMTGGMGAVCPSPIATPELEKAIKETIIAPLVRAVKEEFGNYWGPLYIALMIVDGKPYVIEVNVRFGDPETQVVLPRVKTDLIPIFQQISLGNLQTTEVEVIPYHAACVVLVSDPYPDTPHKGQQICGLEAAAQIVNGLILHAGTKMQDEQLVANGGRVLNLVGFGTQLQNALDVAYEMAPMILFEHKRYRKDIGQRK